MPRTHSEAVAHRVVQIPRHSELGSIVDCAQVNELRRKLVTR